MKNDQNQLKESSPVMSLFFWTVLIFVTLFYTVSSILFFSWIYIFSRPKAQKVFHQVAVLWAKSIVGAVRIWKIEVRGAENHRQGQHYLVIANHQSILDILVALVVLPMPFKFMAKKELFQIPFLGWHMFFAGYIPVGRSSPESRRLAVQSAKQYLQAGESILMFPEGTRSLNGHMLPFKPGAFKLAQNERMPLLPLVIAGTMQGIRKKSWRVARNVLIQASIQEPILLSEDDEQMTEKIQEIRDKMIQDLAALRAQSGNQPE
ncbi:MAG: 1-acyl-sn-glycerol-3-phosphate acyltransferase [Candidatus Omnitrophica bacterium]|nr:1-acyl-sn-glycerol-3-phosphate acyltransferase [Candidatus Omnitrophota bacterium]